MNVAVAPRAGLSGLACLAAIARFHGLDLSEPYLLQVASPGRDGRISPGNLVRVAHKVGLSAKLAKMAWRRLAGLGQALPAILPLRDGEAVIFSGLKESEGGVQVVVRDLREPKLGFQFWDRATLEANWGGEVILVKRKYALSDESQPFGLRWFIPEFLRQRRAFGDVVVAALTLQVLALATPIFFQLMIDRVVVHRVEATMIVLTIGVVLAILFDTALSYSRGMILLYATSKIDIRLATAIFRKMISLPVDFFERNLAGVISKHMQQDQRIREFLSGRLLFTLLDATALFVFLPILMFYSLELTAVVLFCAGLIAVIIGLLAATFRRRLTELYRAEGERQAMLVEAIHGINTVKSLGLEPMQSRAWDQSSAHAIERRIEVGRVSNLARAASSSIEKAMLIAVVFFGVKSIFASNLTVGALVAFQMLAGRVTGPLVQITTLINEFQEVALSVRMLGNVMNAASEPGMSRGLRPAIRGKVTFED